MLDDGARNGSCARGHRRGCFEEPKPDIGELDNRPVHTAALAGTLDGLASALLLLDADGTIVHANMGGKLLLSAAEVLLSSSRRLVTCNAAANRRLHDFLAAASPGEVTVLNITGPDGRRWIAHLLKLAANAPRAAAVALHLRPLTLDLMQPAATLGQLYHLTPSELRVLVAIVSDGGISKTARALGMSTATVKTHLQRIFDKTSIRRQADLVKLVAAFASPFGGFIATAFWGGDDPRGKISGLD